MLIKPINDIRNPRHILDDDTDETTPHPIPKVSIDLEITTIKNIVIIPKTISILQDELNGLVQIGSVKIDYPELLQLNDEETQSYDEDEQLYTAIRQREINTKYPTMQIPIYSIDKENLILTVPHFFNTIAYNVLARQLVKVCKPQQSWFLVSPCSMNNNQTIAIMESNSLFESIPVLTPPHTITGISAAIISQLPPTTKSISLVINSEGQLGFEKSDNDAIVDVCVILGEFLQLSNKEEYLKRVSLKVRKFNGYSNLGMYI